MVLILGRLLRGLLPLGRRWGRRGLHLLVGILGRHLQGPRRNHQAHGNLEVVGFHLVAAAEGRMGPGHPHCVQLGAMAFHPAPQGFLHQVTNLLAADLHIGQPLARQQQLGGQGIGVLLPLRPKRLTGFRLGQGALGDLDPLLELQDLVGRQADGKAVEQVVAHGPLFGVVGGDQQATAGVAQAEPLPFNPIFTGAHRRQQQVGDVVVEQVELVDVEHAPMGFSDQARLEYRLP